VSLLPEARRTPRRAPAAARPLLHPDVVAAQRQAHLLLDRLRRAGDVEGLGHHFGQPQHVAARPGEPHALGLRHDLSHEEAFRRLARDVRPDLHDLAAARLELQLDARRRTAHDLHALGRVDEGGLDVVDPEAGLRALERDRILHRGGRRVAQRGAASLHADVDVGRALVGDHEVIGETVERHRNVHVPLGALLTVGDAPEHRGDEHRHQQVPEIARASPATRHLSLRTPAGSRAVLRAAFPIG